MSGETQALSTLEDIDAEIARLTEARDEQQRLLDDPQERQNRQLRREQLAGRWVVTLQLHDNHLQEIRKAAGEEAWLFEPGLLQSDGWVRSDDGKTWKFRR